MCNSCHGVIDVPDNMDCHFTFDEFLSYRAFREENQQLKHIFNVTDAIDMGLFDTKIVFDRQNRLLCFDKNLDKTIFTGDQIVSFVIKEDSAPLYEGSTQGLIRYPSQVTEQVMAMAPRIEQIKVQRQMREALDRLADKDNSSRSGNRMIDVPEPFQRFNVEIRFQHPYWKVIQCDMNGPTFDMDTPDTYEYLQEYREDIHEMEKLVSALMAVAFPGAPERTQGAAGAQASGAAQAGSDPAEEIKKYMALMQQGAITPAEFEAKKKQLLGI